MEVADAEALALELGRERRAIIEKVNQEDSLATTELAKAMRSRKAARGPLSHFEGTIAQFYKYLARTLAADRVPLGRGAQ